MRQACGIENTRLAYRQKFLQSYRKAMSSLRLPHELNPLWLANVAVMTTLLLAQNQHSCHQPQTEPPWL